MAWRDIGDDLKNLLAQDRSNKALQRQHVLAQDFSKLMAFLQQKDLNPFDHMVNNFIEAMGECCESFREGGHWEHGDTCNNQYFYRIETFESFVCKHRPFFYSDFEISEHILINAPTDRYSGIFQDYCNKFFEYLFDRYENKHDWQTLQNLASQYFGYRGFTWWTNDFVFEKEGAFPQRFRGSQLSQENRWLVDFAFKVGITSDWLSDNLLFLRLDSAKMDTSNIKIPSIIDAFQQPIFSPQQLNESSRWGKAINLKEDIKPYYREYVIKHAPMQAIEYIPVRIDTNSLNAINPNARFDGSLVKTLIDNT